MKISAAFPPVPDTPAHIELAEQLGYETAWVYDTPALQLDVWMTLALAASRTERIRLGPGVLIPSLRHPMVTAAAITTLVGLVGQDRVVIGAGTGFTGRRAMGQKPLKWAEFPGMVGDVQALLRGEAIEVDGELAQMLHWPGQAANRPIEVPWILGVNGPRGLAAAADMGAGVFTSRPRPDADYVGIDDVILLGFGTILDEGETPDSPRVIDTAGPGVTVAYHAFLEQGDARIDGFPNAARFQELAAAVPDRERHLHLHEGHLTELNAIDREVITGDALAIAPFVCPAAEVAPRLDRLTDQGVTEVAFQPMGDIDRELRAFAEAALG
ncbi:MAG: LLM class flavin-dependent oxidoreductase [Actinomycetia bacterium]|nr:LLM class flavin-dependent oxidoreductase [Actinomycetes bacterium]MCP3911757.1 LLM class flavin-dependent oxidoreductase [Actinomycetes bacterium]MCP4086767.1 LLM class flavin-dependent oxidoreductase [Actinomycetes bacterium]